MLKLSRYWSWAGKLNEKYLQRLSSVLIACPKDDSAPKCNLDLNIITGWTLITFPICKRVASYKLVVTQLPTMKYLPCFGQKHLRILCLAKHYCLELSFQWCVAAKRQGVSGKQFVRSDHQAFKTEKYSQAACPTLVDWISYFASCSEMPNIGYFRGQIDVQISGNQIGS